MTTFLLVLSLFLNLLAFFAIIILFLRQNRLSEVEKKQEKMIREMEEVISSYLVQMKEENDKFLMRIRKVDIKEKQSGKTPNKVLANSVDEVSDSYKDMQLKERTGKIPVQKAASVYQKYAEKKAVDLSAVEKIELPPLEVTPEKKDNSDIINKTDINHELQDQSLLTQVLTLQKQGYSEEEIAKKLNRGKTEIALLLKFNQNF